MHLRKGSIFLWFLSESLLKKCAVTATLLVLLFSGWTPNAEAWTREAADPIQGRGWFCSEYFVETEDEGENVGDNGIICAPQNPSDERRWAGICVNSGSDPCYICESPDGEIDGRSVEDGGECTLQSQNRLGWVGLLPGIDREIYGVNEEGGVTEESIIREADESIFAAAFSGAGNWLSGITLEFVSLFIWFFTEILVWMTWAILAIVGGIFDFVVSEFVIQMAKYITAENAGAVREAWTVIRDLANIAIVGGLVATAIGTIVGSQNYNVSKNLARLILAALLVNFSYFIAGAVIDVSNFTAKSAYDTSVCYTRVDDNTGEESRVCSIASRFGEAINFWGLRQAIGDDARSAENEARSGAAAENTSGYTEGNVDGRSEESHFDEGVSPSRHATYNIFLLVFGFVTTFIFLSAISLLVARFVVLIFLLVTSPIGIAGPAVPFLQKYADQWWKALISQAMFAPVYFILVGISLNILDVLAGEAMRGDIGGWGEFSFTGSLKHVAQIATLFTIAIGFMWAALEAAKKMSQEGSEYFKPIYDYANKGLGWMPEAYKNLAARTLVSSIGSGAEATLERYNRFMGRKDRGLLGRTLQGALRRADQPIKSFLEGASKQKFGGKESFEELRKRQMAREEELSGIGEREKVIKKLTEKDPETGERNIDKLERLRRAAFAAGSAEDPKAKPAHDAYNKFKSEIGGGTVDITPGAFKRMVDRREWERLRGLVPFLSEQQFKELAHNKEIPKNIRNQFHELRMKPIKDLNELAQGRIAELGPDGKVQFDKDGHIKYRAIDPDKDIPAQREQARQDLIAADRERQAAEQLAAGVDPKDFTFVDITPTEEDINGAIGGMNYEHFADPIANEKGGWKPKPGESRVEVTRAVEAQRADLARAARARAEAGRAGLVRMAQAEVEAGAREAIAARARTETEGNIEAITASIEQRLGRPPMESEIKRAMEAQITERIEQEMQSDATRQAIEAEAQQRATRAIDQNVAEEVEREIEERIETQLKENRASYAYVQDQLYTLFKYGGIAKGEMVTFMKHDPTLLENQTLFDGGLTHGSKMAIYESGELTVAQRELAKNTWQTSVREANEAIAKFTAELAEGRPKGWADTPEGRLEIAENIRTRPEFRAAVAVISKFGDGKQPHEFSGQIHDNDLLAPALAVSVSTDVMLELTKTHDPVYWKGMIQNLVAMVKSGYGQNNPAEMARLRGVFSWFSSSGAQTSGMDAALGEALAQQFGSSKESGQRAIEQMLGGEKIKWA